MYRLLTDPYLYFRILSLQSVFNKRYGKNQGKYRYITEVNLSEPNLMKIVLEINGQLADHSEALGFANFLSKWAQPDSFKLWLHAEVVTENLRVRETEDNPAYHKLVNKVVVKLKQ